MAREYPLPPSAAALSSSLRDLGYSLEAAIADLIDNSISAKASKCDVFCDLTLADPVLAIVDNGNGMTGEEVIDAMRHGTKSPGEERSPDDLGKFGLGLKTASLSQCRRLTVVSRKDGVVSGAEWNLDLVDAKDDWIITLLEEKEIEELAFIGQLERNGTIVIWRSLDRLFEDKTGKQRDELVNEKLDAVEKHLALVFHRFLAGELKTGSKLAITINGHAIEAFDPFCRKNEVTQLLPLETVSIDTALVKIQPYILPHHSKLSQKEYDYYQGRSDFLSNQGAYIYRNGRLMAWGDWFRLIPKGETTKLARVQIDFPSSLDDFWAIDIKKSRAKPPLEIRERLRQIIDKIAQRSVSVYQQRGKKLFEENKFPIWERYADKDQIRYAINNQHPLIQTLATELNEKQSHKLDGILQAIASALPVDTIHSDYSTEPKDIKQSEMSKDRMLKFLNTFKDDLFYSDEGEVDKVRELLRSTRLFEQHWDTVEKFIGERNHE